MPPQDSSMPARLILEQIADAVIYADAAGTNVLWNDTAAALFGYSAAEAVGQSLNLIIPEHLQKARWSAFEAAITSGVMRLQGRPTLTRAKHQSGSKLYVEMTFALVRRTGSAARGAAHGVGRLDYPPSGSLCIISSALTTRLAPGILRHRRTILNISPVSPTMPSNLTTPSRVVIVMCSA